MGKMLRVVPELFRGDSQKNWVEHSIKDYGVCGWYIDDDEEWLVLVREEEHQPSWVWGAVRLMHRGVGLACFGDHTIEEWDPDVLVSSDVALKARVGGFEEGFYELELFGVGYGGDDWNVWVLLGDGLCRSSRTQPDKLMSLLFDESPLYLAWMNGLLLSADTYLLSKTSGGFIEGLYFGELEGGPFVGGVGSDVMENADILSALSVWKPGMYFNIVDQEDDDVKAFSFYSEG